MTDGLNDTGKSSWKKINTREGKDMNTPEDVYERMMNGGEIQKQIERIGGHEWIKIIEGDI